MRWGPPAILSPVTENRARGKRVTSSRSRAERSTRGNVIYKPGPDTFPLLLPAMAWCHRWIIVGRKNWAPACKWGLRYAMRSTNRHSDVTRDSNNEGASESQRDHKGGSPQPQAQSDMTSSFGITSFRLGKPCLFRTSQPPGVNPTINWYLSALRMTENILVDSY